MPVWVPSQLMMHVHAVGGEAEFALPTQSCLQDSSEMDLQRMSSVSSGTVNISSQNTVHADRCEIQAALPTFQGLRRTQSSGGRPPSLVAERLCSKRQC